MNKAIVSTASSVTSLSVTRLVSIKKVFNLLDKGVNNGSMSLEEYHNPNNAARAKAFKEVGVLVFANIKSDIIPPYKTNRCAANVIENTAVWMDIDSKGEHDQYSKLVEVEKSGVLAELLNGFNWIMHETTSSHPDKLRGRLIVFTKPFDPGLLHRAIKALSLLVGVGHDASVKDPSRCLFLPVNLSDYKRTTKYVCV